MGKAWNWPGGRWWRCDLHLHTPASEDFVDRDTVTPADWIAAATSAELGAVAVTDHNTGAYVNRILEAARENGHPLAVFPGVELTVEPGLHILVLFDPDGDGDAVTAFLGLCEIPHDKLGKSEACSPLSVLTVLQRAHDSGALVIAAHVNQRKGLLKVIDPGTSLQRIVTNESLSAVEVNSDEAADLLEYLDNSKEGYQRASGPLPRLTFSDAHEIDEIGTRSTWIKMTRPDLEGLRLALRDGPLSVRSAVEANLDPNDHATLTIESIEIRESRYIGRSEPFELRLNPWMNAVIGGRGTGKSSVVEFLRMAMRREDELPKGLQGGLNNLKKVARDRSERGLLTPETQIHVTYRKNGGRFRAQWSHDGNLPPILEENSDGAWTPTEGEVRSRFPVRVYSQKQIFELAGDPKALLLIVDQAPNVGSRRWLEKWKEEETRFLALRARSRELEAKLEEEPRLKGELDDVRRKLAVFEKAGHAKILRTYQLHQRQEHAVEQWDAEVSSFDGPLRELAETLEAPELDADLFADVGPEVQPLSELTGRATQRIAELQKRVEEIGTDLRVIVGEWREEVRKSRWQKAVHESGEEYEHLLAELGREGIRDTDEYRRLVQDRQLLEENLANLDALRPTLAKVKRDAEESLGRLRELRRQRSDQRASFLRRVVTENKHVRIKVVPYGSTSTAEDELRRLLEREVAFKKDIGGPREGGLLGELYEDYPPRGEGAPRPEVVTQFEEKLKKQKTRLKDLHSGQDRGDIKDSRFGDLVASLEPEKLDRLDLWFPADSLQVSYSSPNDRGRFKPIDQASPGQKSAAILAFLLSYGEEPIILDQPEDDLDNHLIYDLIVAQLREIKLHRQVVVVTHNPNIVVNGDAELVIALDVGGGQTRILCAGGLQEQEVRDEICRVMEGGREAFEKRYRRIVAGGGDVRQS